jgi:HAD superfamily hydrolase (TIGR01509 family)
MTHEFPSDLPAAVLFDMDGTLTDTEPLWDKALRAVAADFGGALTEAQRASLVGGNLPLTVRAMREATGTTASDEEIASAVLKRIEELFAQDVPLRPGAESLLSTVHEADIPAALVTSTHRAPAEAALRSLGTHWFDVVVTGDDVDRHKPDPLPYLMAARLLGVSAYDCVAIEDSRPGIASALAAGCAVIAVGQHVPDKCLHVASLDQVDLRMLQVSGER